MGLKLITAFLYSAANWYMRFSTKLILRWLIVICHFCSMAFLYTYPFRKLKDYLLRSPKTSLQKMIDSSLLITTYSQMRMPIPLGLCGAS